MTMTTTTTTTLEMLPDDTPLPTEFHSDLTAGCTVRVLAAGTQRAVLCSRVGPMGAMVRDAWTSDKHDVGLARGILDTIRASHTPDAAVTVRVRTDETALQTAVKQRADVRLLGSTQWKNIDEHAAQTALHQSRFTARTFTEDEYTQWVHDEATYYAHLLVELGEERDKEEAYARMRDETTSRLPLGIRTPTHHFRILFDEQGVLLGRAWFDVQGDKSYCFKFLIEEAYRGRGIGKALLAAWEAEAGRLGASRLALHVYDQNKPAQRLYKGYGFQSDAQTFVLKAKTKA